MKILKVKDWIANKVNPPQFIIIENIDMNCSGYSIFLVERLKDQIRFLIGPQLCSHPSIFDCEIISFSNDFIHVILYYKDRYHPKGKNLVCQINDISKGSDGFIDSIAMAFKF